MAVFTFCNHWENCCSLTHWIMFWNVCMFYFIPIAWWKHNIESDCLVFCLKLFLVFCFCWKTCLFPLILIYEGSVFIILSGYFLFAHGLVQLFLFFAFVILCCFFLGFVIVFCFLSIQKNLCTICRNSNLSHDIYKWYVDIIKHRIATLYQLFQTHVVRIQKPIKNLSNNVISIKTINNFFVITLRMHQTLFITVSWWQEINFYWQMILPFFICSKLSIISYRYGLTFLIYCSIYGFSSTSFFYLICLSSKVVQSFLVRSLWVCCFLFLFKKASWFFFDIAYRLLCKVRNTTN